MFICVILATNFLHIFKEKSYSSLVLALVIVITAICAIQLPKMRFDYDFEAFFPNENKELELYNSYREVFGYDNEFVLIAVENKQGIFRKDFLLRADSLVNDLLEVPNVVKVNSPTRMKQLNMQGILPFQQKLMHIEDTSLYRSDSILIYRSPELVGSFFPTDAKSISIFIKTEDILSKAESDSLSTSLVKILEKYRFDGVHYVGRIFAQKVYLENLQREFVIFITLAFLMVILFLWISFRSLYGIIIPVIVVLVSIVWTLGIMKILNKPIDIMTVMLPTMIFIAGLSDVVHFFSKYMEESYKGTSAKIIYKLIFREVGFPTFLTLLTTIVGFLSLLFSSIKPIRDFGIYTSVGIGIAFILSYSFLPAMLILFPPRKKLAVVGQSNLVNKSLTKVFFFTVRRQKTILLVFFALLMVSVAGIFKIRSNNILLEDLSEKVKIKRDFIFFDTHYSGVRPLEVKVSLLKKDKLIWDDDVISEINKVEEFIKGEFDAGFIISPAQLIKSINKISYGGIYCLPSDSDYTAIRSLILENRKNKELQKIVAPSGTETKISTKIRDIGSLKIREHNLRLMNFIEQHTDKELLHFEITGAAHLVDRNNEYMVNNMMQGFLFSVIVIALVTFLLHRSWRMVIVFLIPNLVPLAVIAGLMGYMGIELKSATSLVFSIALGIATDDTIHFISRLKIELAYGKSLLYAFKRTFFETGKPILLTTFILCGGFVSLMSSNFQSVFYFGFLICITIIIALISDLLLLPVLLFWLYGKRK